MGFVISLSGIVRKMGFEIGECVKFWCKCIFNCLISVFEFDIVFCVGCGCILKCCNEGFGCFYCGCNFVDFVCDLVIFRDKNCWVEG